MPPSLNRPEALRHVSYTTLHVAWGSIAEMEEPLAELRRALDDLEGVAAYDRPEQDKIDRALVAIDQLPELAAAVEEALSARKIETLMRRVARIRGVKSERFANRSGRRRFGL